MRKEQVIVLQKKTIIIFSLLVVMFLMGTANFQKNTVLAASRDEITKVYTDYVSDESLFKVEVVGNVEPVKQRVIDDEKPQQVSYAQNGNNQSNYVVSRGSYIRETNNEPPTDYEEVITVRSTAYCLCQKCTGKTPGSAGYGHTASGFVIIPGQDMKVIAVDPSVIPLGSQVYVEGYGYAIAADTGGAIKGNRIDVYKDTHALALQWGSRTVNVYLLKDEEI